jgi:hypothetical protein
VDLERTKYLFLSELVFESQPSHSRGLGIFESRKIPIPQVISSDGINHALSCMFSINFGQLDALL